MMPLGEFTPAPCCWPTTKYTCVGSLIPGYSAASLRNAAWITGLWSTTCLMYGRRLVYLARCFWVYSASDSGVTCRRVSKSLRPWLARSKYSLRKISTRCVAGALAASSNACQKCATSVVTTSALLGSVVVMVAKPQSNGTSDESSKSNHARRNGPIILVSFDFCAGPAPTCFGTNFSQQDFMSTRDPGIWLPSCGAQSGVVSSQHRCAHTRILRPMRRVASSICPVAEGTSLAWGLLTGVSRRLPKGRLSTPS